MRSDIEHRVDKRDGRLGERRTKIGSDCLHLYSPDSGQREEGYFQAKSKKGLAGYGIEVAPFNRKVNHGVTSSWKQLWQLTGELLPGSE